MNQNNQFSNDEQRKQMERQALLQLSKELQVFRDALVSCSESLKDSYAVMQTLHAKEAAQQANEIIKRVASM